MTLLTLLALSAFAAGPVEKSAPAHAAALPALSAHLDAVRVPSSTGEGDVRSSQRLQDAVGGGRTIDAPPLAVEAVAQAPVPVADPPTLAPSAPGAARSQAAPPAPRPAVLQDRSMHHLEAFLAVLLIVGSLTAGYMFYDAIFDMARHWEFELHQQATDVWR